MRELPASLASALESVGDRWSLLVVGALLDGPKRFGELQQELPGVATNMLAARLRQLERHGLVVGEPYSTRPLRLEYRATARAAELGDALRLLAAWGGRDPAGAPGAPGAAHPAHGICGTPLEVRYFCPTCQQVVEAEEEEVWL